MPPSSHPHPYPHPRSPSPSLYLNPLTLSTNTDLTPLPTYKPACTTSLTFDSLLPRCAPLLLHEDLADGCGGQLWPAGMVLGKWLLRYWGRGMEDELILELGSGGGLVGLAVAIGCEVRRPLYITDQENMVSLMERNIALNNLQDAVVPLVLDWGSELPPQIIQNRPTVILAADCVYFEPAFPLLLQTLKDLLAPFPNLYSSSSPTNDQANMIRPRCYFCFKKRRRADMQFLKAAKKVFVVEEVVDEDKKVWEREGLFMFCLKMKESKL